MGPLPFLSPADAPETKKEMGPRRGSGGEEQKMRQAAWWWQLTRT